MLGWFGGLFTRLRLAFVVVVYLLVISLFVFDLIGDYMGYIIWLIVVWNLFCLIWVFNCVVSGILLLLFCGICWFICLMVGGCVVFVVMVVGCFLFLVDLFAWCCWCWVCVCSYLFIVVSWLIVCFVWCWLFSLVVCGLIIWFGLCLFGVAWSVLLFNSVVIRVASAFVFLVCYVCLCVAGLFSFCLACCLGFWWLSVCLVICLMLFRVFVLFLIMSDLGLLV